MGKPGELICFCRSCFGSSRPKQPCSYQLVSLCTVPKRKLVRFYFYWELKQQEQQLKIKSTQPLIDVRLQGRKPHYFQWGLILDKSTTGFRASFNNMI